MKFQTFITEDDGTPIIDTGQLPENAKVVFQIEGQEVIIENIVTNTTWQKP